VPVDLFSAPIVKSGSVTIKAEEHRLIVGTRNPHYEALAKAAKVACIALNELPKTPLFAAGFNIRFKGGNCTDLAKITECPFDEGLSESGYEILARGLARRIRPESKELSMGVINVSLNEEGDEASRIELNFHRDSKDVEDLRKWLSVSMDVIRGEADKFLTSIGVEATEEK